MPAPMPSMGQRVIVQDLSAEPPVESSPGIVISGEPDGTAVVFVMTVNGSEVIEDISWDDTNDTEPSPDKCWRYNWATP